MCLLDALFCFFLRHLSLLCSFVSFLLSPAVLLVHQGSSLVFFSIKSQTRAPIVLVLYLNLSSRTLLFFY